MPVTAVTELDRQIDRLCDLGWPALAELPAEDFRARLTPLRAAADRLDVPYVVVATRRLVDPHAAMPQLELRGRTGFTSMERSELATFRPVVEVPDVDAYLLLDVDPGPGTLNQPPAVALPGILASGRSPLTVEEGVAVVAQQPELLQDQNCFSLAGSRCGDKRVPALWLSARRPRLGWCWEGAPHTWLGTASCGGREAAS